jgi:hypothetical protein
MATSLFNSPPPATKIVLSHWVNGKESPHPHSAFTCVYPYVWSHSFRTYDMALVYQSFCSLHICLLYCLFNDVVRGQDYISSIYGSVSEYYIGKSMWWSGRCLIWGTGWIEENVKITGQRFEHRISQIRNMDGTHSTVTFDMFAWLSREIYCTHKEISFIHFKTTDRYRINRAIYLICWGIQGSWNSYPSRS